MRRDFACAALSMNRRDQLLTTCLSLFNQANWLPWSDPVALAKVLTKIAKDTPAFQFRAGWVQGRVISIQEIGQLALLPSKEELISKIMFMLNAPAQRLATALAALPRNIAVVTSEAVKANKFGSGGGASESEPAPAVAQ